MSDRTRKEIVEDTCAMMCEQIELNNQLINELQLKGARMQGRLAQFAKREGVSVARVCNKRRLGRNVA